jgi:Transglutaminase-like superfamily
MGSLARFVTLPARDQRLIVAAAGLLAAIRVGLWLLPLRWVQGVIRALETSPPPPDGRGPPLERIGWAVAVAGRRVPGSTCLVRALAAQGLFARYGYASQLRLGVARGSGRAFEAHAWLERDGQVLVGGPVEARYVPLPALDAQRPPQAEGRPIQPEEPG